MHKIKLLFCDIDGTLTDAKVYNISNGLKVKVFSVRDGRGFKILKEKSKIKIFLITSEKDKASILRAKKFFKLKIIDGFFIEWKKSKFQIMREICNKNNCSFCDVAYIGDDTNDIDCLTNSAIPACPSDAHKDIKSIQGIRILKNKGGDGAVREFIDYLLDNDFIEKKEFV